MRKMYQTLVLLNARLKQKQLIPTRTKTSREHLIVRYLFIYLNPFTHLINIFYSQNAGSLVTQWFFCSVYHNKVSDPTQNTNKCLKNGKNAHLRWLIISYWQKIWTWNFGTFLPQGFSTEIIFLNIFIWNQIKLRVILWKIM